MPRLVEIDAEYASRGVKVVSVDGGPRSPAAEQFLTENNVRHIVLNDPQNRVMDAYRIAGVPTTVLIDHEGRVVFRHVGFAPEMKERFEKEIETLLAWKGEA